MFDLYLYQGCTAPPDVNDLVDQIPAAQDPGLYAKLQEWRPGGFLGLDLPEDVAHAFLLRLKRAGARGHMALSAYRDPKISVDAARSIAEQVIAQLQQAHFPSYTFDEVKYGGEGPWWWIFGAASEQLQAEGRIPGALFAYVDKLDGHVWHSEEMENLLEAQE
jgi:hypothetical protein